MHSVTFANPSQVCVRPFVQCALLGCKVSQANNPKHMKPYMSCLLHRLKVGDAEMVNLHNFEDLGPVFQSIN